MLNLECQNSLTYQKKEKEGTWYSLINTRQYHIVSIKQKLDMRLFVDFCVFDWIYLI